jgi:hypothetical protein
MIIYLDMDDVVADWHSRAQEILELRWDKNGDRIPQEEWDRIKADLRFYRDLPLMAGARELVQRCEQAVTAGQAEAVRFLTALPHDYSMPFAANDKVWWAHERFPGIPVFLGPFSHDKWRHCRPGDILIDDRVSNCAEWQQAGGLAHIYRSWTECEPWLESVLNLQPVVK